MQISPTQSHSWTFWRPITQVTYRNGQTNNMIAWSKRHQQPMLVMPKNGLKTWPKRKIFCLKIKGLRHFINLQAKTCWAAKLRELSTIQRGQLTITKTRMSSNKGWLPERTTLKEVDHYSTSFFCVEVENHRIWMAYFSNFQNFAYLWDVFDKCLINNAINPLFMSVFQITLNV